MDRRSLALLVAAVGAVSVAAAGDARTTAWGDPDIQGIWAPKKYQEPELGFGAWDLELGA